MKPLTSAASGVIFMQDKASRLRSGGKLVGASMVTVCQGEITMLLLPTGLFSIWGTHANTK